MTTYTEAAQDLAAIRILGNGISEYCQMLIDPETAVDAAELLDDTECNALYFEQIRAGLATLGAIIDRATLIHP